MFCDIKLARRLEEAEGYACAQFAVARATVQPNSASEWMRLAGAYVVFDGADSPVTQTFCLGMHEQITDAVLEAIENFFCVRGAPTQHEVSPLAGIDALRLLVSRGYQPIEISNVLCRTVQKPEAGSHRSIEVRVTRPEEAQLWSSISARGWAHEHPEFLDFLSSSGRVAAAKKDTFSFLAAIDGVPGAAGALCLHEGVALFSGSSTVPEMRRRGFQSALLEERLAYAFAHSCDLAMMVAEAGSESQRNAERKGFHVAYTRLKWALPSKD